MQNPKDLESAIELTKDKFGGLSKIVSIRWKNVKRGFARYDGNKITLPLWILGKNEGYALYYVLHEISHLITCWQYGPTIATHGREFKEVEKQVMDCWDIQIEYARAYPKRVFVNGQKCYEKP